MEPAHRLRSRRPVRVSLQPRHRARAHARRTRAGQALRAAGDLVDLSYLNEAGFWDVAGADAGPLVASHSGVHALCPASRNLTDPQLDAIGASGGLVGIVYGCPFLRPDFADVPDTPLALIAQHAAYVAERLGVARVALGSDFDGATIPDELGDVAEAVGRAGRRRLQRRRGGSDRLGQLAPGAGPVVG